MEDKEAQAISAITIQQLGGRHFQVMTGAHTFNYDRDGTVRFHLPKRAKSPNVVKIELTPLDLYRVTLTRTTTRKGMPAVQWEHVHDNIYCDQLRGLFERETGLRTSLNEVFA